MFGGIAKIIIWTKTLGSKLQADLVFTKFPNFIAIKI